ncbi:hypothetical protein B0T26DRAFT_675656 [Lasiosphaeria miniovina]|uniref:Uncharacterized protein n=1 Tax=Lasiosphaeria miniovina TaxID=1954250 RepID=A0AA40DZN1_9PEZI|nr:uncharacterized protein B0T26DRAFT_675656 [Lasiosphaeria miniovina]KAK0717333.1 hypothetical protein B0T26DRAFT_675656 [Lasiosphaeria miniovina]
MSTQSVAVASHNELNRNSLFNMKGRVALDIEGEIIALTADVASKQSIAKLVREIESREKCLCILVNNAGITSESVTTETETASDMKRNLFDNDKATFDDWTDTYRTNVASIYFVTAAFLPLLQKSLELHPGWPGTVINISSVSGLVKSAQHHFAYNASKAAAVHLTRMLSAEIAESGHKIRVNSIAPGIFPSEMTAQESNEFQKSHIPRENYAKKVPAARPGRDVDMAQAVLMLAAKQ